MDKPNWKKKNEASKVLLFKQPLRTSVNLSVFIGEIREKENDSRILNVVQHLPRPTFVL